MTYVLYIVSDIQYLSPRKVGGVFTNLLI